MSLRRQRRGGAFSWVMLAVLALGARPAAAQWRTLRNARLAEERYFDGDSFELFTATGEANVAVGASIASRRMGAPWFSRYL